MPVLPHSLASATSAAVLSLPRTAGVLLWVLLKLLLAALATEVISLSLMFGLPGGFLLIYLHAADRVLMRSHDFSPLQKLLFVTGGLLAGYCPAGANRNKTGSEAVRDYYPGGSKYRAARVI